MTSSAYLFPGQGSQSVGMGRLLHDEFAIARDTFAEADALLGFSLSALCFEGPAEELTATQNAQPALLTVSIAAMRALGYARPELDRPAFVAGHSMGEYSALVAAGALSFADGVRLIRVRGELMAAPDCPPGMMAAIVRLEDDQVAALCAEAAGQSGEIVQVANYNSPGQVVISGTKPGVEAAMALAKGLGGRAIPLAVSIGAHSALMNAAAARFAAHLEQTPLRTPEVCVIGNVTARPLESPAAIRAELQAQLTSPVRWTASIQAMMGTGVDRFVEVGPGQVLAGLTKRIVAGAVMANVALPAEVAAL